MSPPRELFYVEWEAAVLYDRPNERRTKHRSFQSAGAASAQLRALELWPDHMTLTGVWRSIGRDGKLDWQPVDPAELPLDPVAADRYAALDAGMIRPDFTPQEAPHDHPESSAVG